MSAWTKIRNKVTRPLDELGKKIDDNKVPIAAAALAAYGGYSLLPYLTGATAGTTAAGALGELGINTALAAGTPGGIAAGTTVGGLGGYTPELLYAAKQYATNPGNLFDMANKAKQGYGVYKQLTGSPQAGPQAGRAPTGGGGGLSIPSELDGNADFLTGGGGNANNYDLAEVYRQMSQGREHPMMYMNQPTESPKEAFEYQEFKDGGLALSSFLKETSNENNLFPQSKDRDDRPVFLTSQNPGIKTDLAKVKRVKQGLAQGGLPQKYAAAAPQGHRPEFITGITGHYACGKGTGQSDDIPAMLHDGDYVMDAETVSALGDGSSKAGKDVLEGFHKRISYKAGGQAKPVPAKIADGEYVFDEGFVTALGGGDNRRGSDILDGLRERLRAHKRGAPVNKIPPKAKDPAQYIGKGN